MSLESLRKHLVNSRPPNVASATLLGKGYGITTTQVTRLLTKMGYERSTDNTGWYLNQTAPTLAKPTYLAITEETTDKLVELFLTKVPEGSTPVAHARYNLLKRLEENPIDPSRLLEVVAVLAKVAGVGAFTL